MNKKATETELYMVIGGLLIGIIIALYVLYPFLGNVIGSLFISRDKPPTSTFSSFNNLISSIENKEPQQLLVIEGDYGIVFFNKGSKEGLGNFKRPSICFDNSQSCACLCKVDDLGGCSKEGNARKTVCKESEIDKFDLIGFADYIKSGTYKVLLEYDKTSEVDTVKIIKEDI